MDALENLKKERDSKIGASIAEKEREFAQVDIDLQKTKETLK